jgi:hypothetical protein
VYERRNQAYFGIEGAFTVDSSEILSITVVQRAVKRDRSRQMRVIFSLGSASEWWKGNVRVSCA